MPRRLVLVPILVAAALPGSAAAYTNPQIPGLQIALRAHGYDVGPIDGIVGRRTAGAVRAFQRRAGIFADGLPGPKTRRALGPLGAPLFGRRTLRVTGIAAPQHAQPRQCCHSTPEHALCLHGCECVARAWAVKN